MNNPHSHPDLPRRGRSAFVRYATVFVVLSAVVVWFAPAIVMRTSLRDRLLDSALDDFNGRVEIGSSSVGWLSRIVLTDVTASDADGNELLQIPRISSEQTLWQLVSRPQQLGRFIAERPVCNIITWPGGSNLEEVLEQDDSVDEGDGDDSARTWEIVIDDALVRVRHRDGDQQSMLRDIDLVVTKVAGVRHPEIQFDATVVVPDKIQTDATQLVAAGSFSGYVNRAEPLPDGRPPQSETIQIRAKDVSLSAIETLALRYVADAILSGTLNGDITVERPVDVEEPSALIFGSGRIDGFAMSAPQLIGRDRLVVEQTLLKGRVDITADRVRFDAVQLDSDLGRLAATGDLILEPDSSATVGKDLKLTASVDLATIARRLPHTFSLRDDLELESGRAIATFDSMDSHGQQWQARLKAFDLAGRINEEPVRWDEAFAMHSLVSRVENRFSVDELKVQSGFVSASGSGDLANGSFNYAADLSKLRDKLAQFVAFDGASLSGKVTGQVAYDRSPDGRWTAKTSAVATDLAVTSSNDRGWRDDRLEVVISGSGADLSDGSRRLDTFAAKAVSGRDVIQLQLREPADMTQSVYPVDAEARGRLSTWLVRLSPWIKPRRAHSEADVNLVASGAISADAIEFDSLRGSFSGLAIDDENLSFREPRVTVDAAGGWNLRDHRLELSDARLQGESGKVEFKNFAWGSDDDGLGIVGRASIDADLGSLAPLLTSRSRRSRGRFDGRLTTRIEANPQGGQQIYSVRGRVDNFAYISTRTRPSKLSRFLNAQATASQRARWDESSIEFTGLADYNRAADELKIAGLKLVSSAVSILGRGTVSEFSGPRLAQIDGAIEYNLEEISQVVASLFDVPISLRGRGNREFRIKGSLENSSSALAIDSVEADDVEVSLLDSLRDVEAEFGLDWDQANIYGVTAGPGNVQVRLADQRVTTTPIDVAVHDGRLRIQPEVQFREEGAFVRLDGRSRLDEVRITPEVSREWLGYFAPMLADASEVDGLLSMQTRAAMIPLEDFSAADVLGELTIHRADARPGPSTWDLLNMLSQLQVLSRNVSEDRDGIRLTMPAQTVPFRVVRGQVHHRDLQFVAGKVALTTHGYVGLDQTIAVLAEFPLTRQILGSNRYLASLVGQPVRIPIRGTVARPVIDSTALAQLIQQLGQTAAQQYIGNAVQENLQRLIQKNDKADAIGRLLEGNPADGVNDLIESNLGDALEKNFGSFLKR